MKLCLWKSQREVENVECRHFASKKKEMYDSRVRGHLEFECTMSQLSRSLHETRKPVTNTHPMNAELLFENEPCRHYQR